MKSQQNPLLAMTDLPIELHSHIASFTSFRETAQFYSTNRFFQLVKPIFLHDFLKQIKKYLIKNTFCQYDDIYLLDNNNTLFARGANTMGQLGLGDGLYRYSFSEVTNLPAGKKIQKLVTGFSHSFILLEDNTLYACGDNHLGQLGLGRELATCNQFTKVTELPQNKKIRNVITGGNHSFLLFDDDTLFACGDNYDGRLGLGDNKSRQHFTEVTGLAQGKKICDVIAGYCHSFIFFNDSTLLACGDNHQSQLGLKNVDRCNQFTEVTNLPQGKKIRKVITGGCHSFLLFDDGTLLSCGNNSDGQLSLGDSVKYKQFTEVTSLPPGKKIYDLVIGYFHSFLLFDDGTLFSCGQNNRGQLGLGDNKPHKYFTEVTSLPQGKKIRDVVTGMSQSVILFEDGSLVACGADVNYPYHANNWTSFKPIEKFNYWVDLCNLVNQKLQKAVINEENIDRNTSGLGIK